MRYIAKMAGWDTELSRGEYEKLCRYLNRGGMVIGARVLENGTIINLAQLNGVLVEMALGETMPEISAPGFMATEIELPTGAPSGIDTQNLEPIEPAKPEDIISKEEFMRIYADSKLDYAAFAAKIEYGPQTVRMAIKEGRISKALSDAVLKVFPREVKTDG